MFDRLPDRYNPAEEVHGDLVNKQIILNYCFSHPNTTVMLCPYGAGVNYINHNQTMANVKVIWSQHGSTSHNDEALRKTPEELQMSKKATLGLDYVATKDIEEGK